MSSVDSSTPERINQGTAAGGDVWFLSGALEARDTLRHLPIDEAEFTVGRKPGCSLKLQFNTVSGKHAVLSLRSGVLYLRDLGSTNGTYVNGERITGEVAVDEEDLIHFAEAPFRVLRQSPTGQATGTIARNVCDEALALVQFDRMMSEKLVRPHFQVIVEINSTHVVGHEILGRGSVFGLESVAAMFNAASQLNLEVELSQLLRWEGIRVGRDLPPRPKLFVNTHPKEMENAAQLIDSLVKVRQISDNTDLVLEIHEASVTNRKVMRELSAAVTELDIELAFDDFGSGQARLAELIESRPDYVKFDISLIHGIDHADAARHQMLETLVKMVRDLEIKALAEGIETATEAQTCVELGFDLGQGYFYGRPTPI
ncbi:EAL domain-containing protein [Rhodopirellula sp. MGV]|uniref:EAL domain-containing protein n=1 Tax=Rhodopirellula sp. MGV TaxID=2023130 RepID=UPI000B95ED0B|nr:EAL domain-containing protein [Rhodopirellula sp. MGV]OYP32945.1 diguanylate phosphodiesterase [Rhodopirellula sp. MGV]PNY35398.1 diguanylate phosphodiesterase [Rhodopirellula baltica]